jgi:hypothetical protein
MDLRIRKKKGAATSRAFFLRAGRDVPTFARKIPEPDRRRVAEAEEMQGGAERRMVHTWGWAEVGSHEQSGGDRS